MQNDPESADEGRAHAAELRGLAAEEATVAADDGEAAVPRKERTSAPTASPSPLAARIVETTLAWTVLVVR